MHPTPDARTAALARRSSRPVAMAGRSSGGPTMFSKTNPALLVTRRSDADASPLLDATFRAHAPALRGWLIGLTRDPATADDLVSECFLRLATEIRPRRAPPAAPARPQRDRRSPVASRASQSPVGTPATAGPHPRAAA